MSVCEGVCVWVYCGCRFKTNVSLKIVRGTVNVRSLLRMYVSFI